MENKPVEWKKEERSLYLPKAKPQLIDVAEMQFFVLEGTGNPNSALFASFIETLYTASYAVRMSYKSDAPIKDYYAYTVYPLEGVWDLTEEGRALYRQSLQHGVEGVEGLKDHFTFQLMIRQPHFVTPAWAESNLPNLAKLKGNDLIRQIRLLTFTEGKCVQMMHLGPYNTEPASFKHMEDYCSDNGMKRLSKRHREIYLTDARKTVPDKLKTTLRIQVE